MYWRNRLLIMMCNSGAKETGEGTVILTQASKCARKTAATTTSVEISAAVQQCDQQTLQSPNDRRKRETEVLLPLSDMLDTTLSQKVEAMTGTKVRVPENIKKQVSRFLRNKESLAKAQKEVMVTLSDYTCQPALYTAQCLCMSKAGFYYVVFDASQPLNGKISSLFHGEIVHTSLFDDETNLDRLLEYMSAIHIMEPDQSHRAIKFDEARKALPIMFLVGTHADKLREQPDLQDRQDELIRKRLEGSVLAKHIIWASKARMCFYVDNTLTDPQNGTVDSQVHLLRHMTEEVARKVAQQRPKVPITRLKFEQEVRDMKVSDETKKTVAEEDLFHLAKRAAGIETMDELEVLLYYLSNRAVLLYHLGAFESEEKEVVLDVEWFMAQMEKVTTIHIDVPPMLENDVRRSREKGIITASLINHLLSDSSSRQRLLMSLMKYFNLLCQYRGIDDNRMLDKADDVHDYVSLKRTPVSSSESNKEVECSAYLMPCLLQERITPKSAAIDDGCKTVPLILKSESDEICVPKLLFYRLLTRLATRFPRLPRLFANAGYFHIYHRHRLEISLERYCLQMIVFTSNKERLLPAVCFQVREYVTEEFPKAKHPGMFGLELKLGFYYPLTVDSVAPVDDQQDFVSLEGYPASRNRVYVASIQGEIDLPSELKVWYPEISEVNHEVTCHSVIL